MICNHRAEAEALHRTARWTFAAKGPCVGLWKLQTGGSRSRSVHGVLQQRPLLPGKGPGAGQLLPLRAPRVHREGAAQRGKSDGLLDVVDLEREGGANPWGHRGIVNCKGNVLGSWFTENIR